jgi:hypothetical protein
MNIKKAGIILAYAFVGWALCFATIGIGMAVTSQILTIVSGFARDILRQV